KRLYSKAQAFTKAQICLFLAASGRFGDVASIHPDGCSQQQYYQQQYYHYQPGWDVPEISADSKDLASSAVRYVTGYGVTAWPFQRAGLCYLFLPIDCLHLYVHELFHEKTGRIRQNITTRGGIVQLIYKHFIAAPILN